jgi:hypothetical protein
MLHGDLAFVCHTRDISNDGCLLDTVQDLAAGTRVALAFVDPDRGEAIELTGLVARSLPPGNDGVARGFGVRFDEAPDAWVGLVARQQHRRATGSDRPVLRLRVLVVGDDDRRRGALALYVQSGWDVRFASDLDGAVEALEEVTMDAVIVERDLDDPRWAEIMGAARASQPRMRRIMRSRLHGQPAPARGGAGDLVHWVVDLDDGLDALLDALTAEAGPALAIGSGGRS